MSNNRNNNNGRRSVGCILTGRGEEYHEDLVSGIDGTPIVDKKHFRYDKFGNIIWNCTEEKGTNQIGRGVDMLQFGISLV